ncbi:peptidase inhibitor family I36 protein [Phycicoccus sp.]|uniref:peptidase inhibitor family I36 protein n=1 Tax=Phycicoccus sp. TaxID=1902410 RepID=UPI002C56AE2E|nr:peptidase inhibitor family I36 protein [Phycicoccus sp.]HMM93744.1 peptidase inhibitor family I36 protein [Phycicoccus sp.]
MRIHRPLAATALAVLTALTATVTAAQPAAAAARDGVCQSGEFCYYYNSDNAGSVSDFTGSVADYGTTQPSCYDFRGPGNGKGLCVKNNAASVWNRTGKTVRVYYNSDFDGSHHSQDFAPGAKKNLDATLKNNNASHKVGVSSGGGGGCSTDGTNTTPPSSILVYRVSAGRVDRVAFRSYVKNVLPNEWVSSWPRASLRAGAMAVKSYGWYWALHSTRKTSWGACYDVRDDTGDQVYRPSSAVTSTSAAVDDTWGTRMTRGGSILQAHYCSTTTACPAWVSGDWMSQYGSRDLANAGRSWQYILDHYYSGITLH